MNIIINIILLFIYLYGLIGLGVPNIYNDNLVLHKAVIMFSIFAIQFTILLGEKIIRQCKIDASDIAFNSFMTSLIGIIGYSLFTDIKFMNMAHAVRIKKSIYSLYIVIAITMVILLYKLFSIAFNNQYQGCDKYD